MTCGEIIRDYLIKEGYEGLVDKDCECGCDLNDLIPCDSDNVLKCQAGHKIKCSCDSLCCDYHIKAGKRVSFVRD